MDKRRTSQSFSLQSYALEPESRRDSRQTYRAVFLNTIASARPHVINDLWPIFWFYLFSVCERFRSELGIEHETDGAKIYHALFERECRNPDQWQLVTNADRQNWIWRGHFWAFGAIHKLDPEAVRNAFPTWNSPQVFRSVIQNWSEKWHIDAEWCREFGWAVLQRCFFHEGIRESFLHPHKPKQNPFLDPPLGQTLRWRKNLRVPGGKPNDWLRLIWVSTAAEALSDFWSPNDFARDVWPLNIGEARECLKTIVFKGREPREVVFRNFRAPGWNFLDETDVQFRRKATIEFMTHLSAEEKARLTAMHARLARSRITQHDYNTDLAWRDHTLRHFNARLENYLSLMNRQREKAITRHRLTKVPVKTKLKERIEAAVLFQIPNKEGKAETLREIAGRRGLRQSGVLTAVDECLRVMGLEKWRHPKAGRKPGSKNSETSRLLQTLGS